MKTSQRTRLRALSVAAGLAFFATLAAASIPGAQENLGRGRVTGKVMDEGKRPLEGARVVAQSLTALGTKLEARTDGMGGFVIGGLGTGPWRLTASQSGFLDAAQDVDVHQLRPNPPIILVLKKMAVAPPSDETRRAAEDVLTRGNELLAAERYAEARELLESFLAAHPEAYPVRLQIGQCGLKLGELDRAETDLKILLDTILEKSGSYEKEAPLAAQALAGLGETAVKRNDIEIGMKSFRQALDISPTNELLAFNVAEILFANQKTDEAILYYLMAVRIRAEWPKPYHKLGIAYLNKGDFARALDYLRKFVAMDPQSQAAAEARQTIAAVEKIK
jgi:tetratricopeptide (TPR) repeat protein